LARPKIRPSVCMKPLVEGFIPKQPDGGFNGMQSITNAELEALRLRDYLHLNQEEAASIMQISKPSFNRLLLKAREKLVTAVVEGLEIKFEKGRFKGCNCSKQPLAGKYRCPGCHTEWEYNTARDRPRPLECPQCKRDCRQARFHASKQP